MTLSYYSISDASVTEGNAGYVDITITRTGPSLNYYGHRLNITTSNNTANNNTIDHDYGNVTPSSKLIQDETSLTVRVPITEDDIPESTESFFVHISKDNSWGNNTTAVISDGDATVTIFDDDLNLETTSYSISPSKSEANEGETINTTISTENVLEGTTIYWYVSGPGIVKEDFSSGEMSGIGIVDADGNFTFSHTLSNDLGYESTETMEIKLYNNSAQSTQLGSTARVKVNDNDANPYTYYSIGDAHINEGEKGYVEITRTGNISTGPQQVAISSKNDTALKELDFLTPTSLVTFTVGQSSAQIEIDTIEDLEDEGDEVFTLSISSETNNNRLVFNDSSSSITIIDDDQINEVIDYSKDSLYELNNIRDFDGNLHAGASTSVTDQYKHQGQADLDGDGTEEDIFTNDSSGRWASVGSAQDFNDYGAGGNTRVVGTYNDPLVLSGEVEKGGPHDSQTRFANDLLSDNLSLGVGGDFDSDGTQEVYWRTNDGSAYLRSLHHADGNIQYANYQNYDQMSNYLTGNGNSSLISTVVG